MVVFEKYPKLNILINNLHIHFFKKFYHFAIKNKPLIQKILVG